MLDGRLRAGLLAAFVLGLGVSITLAQAALAALAVRLLWRLATGRAHSAGWPLTGAVAAWVTASLLAVLLSSRPLESLSAARGLLLIATFYVVLDAVADRREAQWLLTALLALAAVLGLAGSLQVALCPGLTAMAPALGRVARNCERAHAFYSIYMTLAGVLSLVLLATLPSLLQAGPGRRWRWLAWLLGGLGLALTYVRGAWLGFLAGAVVLLGLVRRGRLLVAAGVLVLIAAVVLTPGLRRRAESIADPTDSTARERLAMWRSGLAMVRDHPLTGIGPGQVKHRYPGYAAPEFAHKRRGHLHNTPLQVAVERGLLGLGTWLALFATFFWRSARLLAGLGPEDRQARAVVVGSIAAVAGFLVGGLTEYNFGDSEVVMVAYTVMALPFVVAGRPRRRPGAVPAPGPAGHAGGPRAMSYLVERLADLVRHLAETPSRTTPGPYAISPGTAGAAGVDSVTTGDYPTGEDEAAVKSVGVKELKARLSEYLRLVRAGEVVLITDRDEVVAELRPAHRQPTTGRSVEERLQALAEAGEVTRPSLPKGRWTCKVKGLGTAAGLLGEVRGDRI